MSRYCGEGEGKMELGLNGICYANVMTRLVAHNIRLPFFPLPTRGGRPKSEPEKGQKPASGWLRKVRYVGADCSVWKWLLSCGWLYIVPVKSQPTHAKLSQTKVNKTRPKQSKTPFGHRVNFSLELGMRRHLNCIHLFMCILFGITKGLWIMEFCAYWFHL